MLQLPTTAESASALNQPSFSIPTPNSVAAMSQLPTTAESASALNQPSFSIPTPNSAAATLQLPTTAESASALNQPSFSIPTPNSVAATLQLPTTAESANVLYLNNKFLTTILINANAFKILDFTILRLSFAIVHDLELKILQLKNVFLAIH